MKKWQLLLPITAAVAGVTAAVVMLQKKTEKKVKATADDAPKAPKAKKAAEDVPGDLSAVGEYSFISGYTDAVTVNMKMKYAPDKFDFAVVSESFLVDTAVSHAVIVRGPEFEFQLEYAAYYGSDDFKSLSSQLREKYRTVSEAVYGSNSGLSFKEGDGIGFVFPVDAHSYVHLVLFKNKDSKIPLEDMPRERYFKAMLDSMEFNVG